MKTIKKYSLELVKEKEVDYCLDNVYLKSPVDAYNVIQAVIQPEKLTEEAFYIITLDVKQKATGLFEVSRGSLDSSIVTPREIYKRAILQNASSIILTHNHPSGDPTPSSDDIRVTEKIAGAGSIIGIKVLDHIITGEGNYTSLRREEGMAFE